MKILIWVIIGISSLLFLRFLLGDAHQTPYPIKKELYVTLKNDTPCFYINSFDGINNFNINHILVDRMDLNVVKSKENYMWLDVLDNNRTLSLSSIVGENQCLLYGIKNTRTSATSKQLQTNVIYKVEIEGRKRGLPENELKNGEIISLYRLFYLVKNSKTGEIKIIFPSTMEVDNWIKKIDENNRSNEIIKENK